MATNNPQNPIQPVSMPAGAAIDYAGGDVRHFSSGDDISVPGMSTPTRHLANRDNMLADKLNEVIEQVNNREQVVPLPIVRTVLAPSDATIVTNYRIPPGFESRVLNATVNSTDVELNVYHSGNTFGGSTGTSILSTSKEYTGSANFQGEGEYIVEIKNKSGASIEVAASVMLTLRPVGSIGSVLVGSTVTGPVGPVGQTGVPGPQGPAGSGGVGTPGMVWKNDWVSGTPYNVHDVVSYSDGGLVSSYILKAAQPSGGLAVSPKLDTASWDVVARGAAGAGMKWKNGWDVTVSYYVNDVVSYNPGTGAVSSYICTVAHTGGSSPAVNTGQWSLVASGVVGATGGDIAMVANTTTVACKLTTAASTYFTGGVFSPAELTGPGFMPHGASAALSDHDYYLPCKEVSFKKSSGSVGNVLLYLNATIRTSFCGWGTITLPGVADADGLTTGSVKPTMDYSNSNISLVACMSGTVAAITGDSDLAQIRSPEVISYLNSTNKFTVAVLNTPRPMPVTFVLSGVQYA